MTEVVLPDPLVPPEVDLRDFAFMPLHVVRLRDSGLSAKATGDQFRAAVLLWCASWHQVPAGSMPNDDDELANVCGYSRSRREWVKVREGAMRGWTACHDGRLYHELVATKALEAWIEKLASAIGGAAGNAKRWKVTIDTAEMRAQFSVAVNALRKIDPQSKTLRKKSVAVLTNRSDPESGGDIGDDDGGESPPDSHPDRNRQGQGQGSDIDVPNGTSSSARPTARKSAKTKPTPDVPCPFHEIVDAYHEHLPSLPSVRLRDGKTWATRQRAMRSLWAWVLSSSKTDGSRRATNGAEALDWIRGYFRRASENDFLMGRTRRSDVHAGWQCDIDFLLSEKGMKQVIEKTHDRSAA